MGKKWLAQIISYAFHPGMAPTFGALLILYAYPYEFSWLQVFRIASTVFLGTYVGPFFGILVLRLSGVISSVHLIKKEERIYPYLIGAFSTLTTANYLQHQHLPEELVLSVFLSAFIIIVSIILLPFLKSSAHMAGISGLFALYLILHQRYDFGNTPGLFVVAMLLCSVAWARLSLNRHTLLELLIGFTVGFFPLFLLLSR